MVNPGGPPPPTLLASKTTIPLVRDGALERPGLTSSMSNAGTPLVVVVAPAGWGKSTLLAQWARGQSREQRVGWLTIDSTDNDPHRFWTYVIAALRQSGSPVGESALAALGVPGLDPMEVALPNLLNDLAQTDHRHTMILDDYHFIEEPRIREAVEFLITYLPVTARFMIGTRIDPALPLALWRGRGLLTEIRASQLRFGTDEAATILGVDPDEAADALGRTEGWPTGIQLVAMAMRGVEDPGQRAAVMRSDHRHLVDYVSSEVLSSLDDNQRDFMMRASVLDQICAQLTDAALGLDQSARLLDQLEQIDPFITRLDDAGVWYRWHPVARDALRRELERHVPGERERVLQKAASWFLAQGQFESGIRHLIAAGASGEATRLLLRHEDDFLEAGDIGTFLGLAEALGPDAATNAPGLGLAMAWAAYVSGARHRVPELLDATTSGLTGTEPPPLGWLTFSGSMSTLWAFAEYEADPDRGASAAAAAIVLETDPDLPGYSVARFALGLVLMAQGEVEAAVARLEEAWDRSDAAGMPVFARLPLAGILAGTLVDLGRADQARALITALSGLCRRLEENLGVAAGPAVGSLRLAEARLELEHGDLDRSREMLARAAELLRVANHPSQTVRALVLLAEAELEADRTDNAREAVANAREIARNDPVAPAVSTLLETTENRLGRSAVKAARTDRRLFEDLTDRELSILRALGGPLSQREIGRELYLSVNTVKGYVKSLYRKLGVASREEAVESARRLGVI